MSALHSTALHPSPIRVLLVDDYELVRQGLCMVINQNCAFKVVGEAQNGSEALQVALQEQPDIILLDIGLGLDNGLDFVPRLLEVSDAHIIVFTGSDDAQSHNEALACGAKAVVVKGDSSAPLLNTIERVYQDQTPQQRPEREKIALLTALERDIIALLSSGLSPAQIGDQMDLEEVKVRKALSEARKKLEVADEVALVVYAYQHGLALPESH